MVQPQPFTMIPKLEIQGKLVDLLSYCALLHQVYGVQIATNSYFYVISSALLW